MKKAILVLAVALVAMACSGKSNTTATESVEEVQVEVMESTTNEEVEVEVTEEITSEETTEEGVN